MKKILISLFTILILIACSGEKNYTYELTRSETHSWSSTGINSIDANTINGSIDVTARQDTTITLDITKKCLGEDSIDAEEHIAEIEISTNISGGELFVNAYMPDEQDRDYTASFDFRMPEVLYLDLSTINGSIAITNMLGGAKVRSINGGFTFQNVEGAIEGETTNGSIDCDMNQLLANESITFTTDNGSVLINLPTAVAVSFDLENDNGNISITGFTNVNYTTNEPRHKVGTINGGGAPIDVITINGDISLEAK